MSREIRPTVAADIKGLADALIQVHSTDGYPVEGVDNPQAWLHLPAALGQWTALLDGNPVGHFGITRPGQGDAAPAMLAASEGMSLDDIAVLVRLFVAPAARGRSLGREMVEKAEEMARAMGLRLTLDVMEKDRDAISLYERQGWVALGSFSHTYGDEERIHAIAMAAPEPRLE
ncbi:GNAT family N-acetyltransferase [Janibacter sp. GS2]|uniref:GNAT family N-acetyltransferase n=1 Tax=Janibacter sp. GS2 TaxID=3442646 RepID=UPI003EBA40D1